MAAPRFTSSFSTLTPFFLRSVPRSTRGSALSPSLSQCCVLPTHPSLRSPFRPTRPFSSTPSPKSADALIELANARRTYYQLGKNSTVSDSKIEELVNAAILAVPAAFNTQSARLVVLLNKDHDRFWDLTIGTFEQLVAAGTIPAEMWKNHTLPKLQGMQAAYGTVLFYEDPAHMKPMQEKFALYKDHFEPWAQHANGMHQYFLWTGLRALGFGANLQHYNPLIDGAVAKEWNVPSDWRLISQLVFGSPEGEPGPKDQKPVGDRVKIYGKK